MIPNTIHAVFGMKPDFGGKPFSMIHYLSVRSAAQANGVLVDIYVANMPEGHWWEQAQPYARVHRIEAPTEIAGVPLNHPAHQTDVFKLWKLREVGGAAMDLDVICLRPFADVDAGDAELVLAREDPDKNVALCNAVTLAAPASKFIDLWLDGYDPAKSHWSGFRSKGFDAHWGEMSTRYPLHLAALHPDLLRVLPSSAFFPLQWREPHLSQFFEEGAQSPIEHESVCVHLWEMAAWSHLECFDWQAAVESRSPFGALVRAVTRAKETVHD